MKCIFVFIIWLTPVIALAQTVNHDEAFFTGQYDQNVFRKQRIESVTIKSFWGDGRHFYTHTYFFDSVGRVVYRYDKDTTKRLPFYKFFYNDRNHLIKTQIFRKDTLETEISFFKSYLNDLLTRDSSDYYGFTDKLLYDSSGLLLSTIRNFRFGTLQIIKENTYDIKRRPISYRETRIDQGLSSLISSRLISYHTNGKRLKEIETIRAESFDSFNKGDIFYKYDAQNRLINLITQHAASYRFEYDKAGLLSKRTIIMHLDEDNPKKEFVTYETYTYTRR